jgi:hypothetical protein
MKKNTSKSKLAEKMTFDTPNGRTDFWIQTPVAVFVEVCVLLVSSKICFVRPASETGTRADETSTPSQRREKNATMRGQSKKTA